MLANDVDSIIFRDFVNLFTSWAVSVCKSGACVFSTPSFVSYHLDNSTTMYECLDTSNDILESCLVRLFVRFLGYKAAN